MLRGNVKFSHIVIFKSVIIINSDFDLVVDVKIRDVKFFFKNRMISIFLNLSRVLLPAEFETHIRIRFAASIIELHKSVLNFDNDGTVFRMGRGCG